MTSIDQAPHQTVTEHPSNLVNASRGHTGDLVTLIAPSGDAGSGGVKARPGGSLPSIAPEGFQGQAHVLPSGSQAPTIGGLATSAKSFAGPSNIEEANHVAEPSAGNPVALDGNVASVAATGAAEDVEGKAEAAVLARLRTIIFLYVAKLPFVGAYLKRDDRPNVEALATETTPLLGAIQDPKAFATRQAEGLLRRVLSPVLDRLPDVDALDNSESDDQGTLFKISVECYVLAKDGGGWLFTYMQENSLVVAPTISLGHLSTTDLAASTIGTAVASVTGYSIIQGFISSLDKVLGSAPNRDAAKIACTQAAAVTGVALLLITSLWVVQSGTLLQQLGQPPEVAGPASEFLRVTAAGLPGYALGEIAKRYLAFQGLSHVHTRILSAIAPVNLVLNYLLVDGPIPALRLGFAGAPLCTVLSHSALAIMLIIYIVHRAIRDEVEYLRGQNTIPDEPARENTNLRPTGDHTSKLSFFAGLGGLVLAGTSGIFKSASELWSKDFGGVVASVLGPNALATQAVLLATATTLYQVPKAVSSASSERMKKWIARGDTKRAKIVAAVAFVGTLAGVIVISNTLLTFATSWGELFNNDPVIIESVSALLPVIAVFQAVHGIGAWADTALGSLGKTAMFPSLNASADYLFGIPLGVYLAFPRQWGLGGLWVGLTVSLAYSCVVATIVLVRTNWKKAVGKRGKNAPGREEVQTIQPTVAPRGFGTFV